MTIHQITFSPTGGTRRASEFLCKGFDANSTITELCTQGKNLNYPNIKADDLVVISMPVYAGRVPALATERLKNVISNGAKCVIIAVYGNRAYEDALVEMQDAATEMGFQVIAAIAAIAEHSICRMYATGRPDDIDAKELASFGTTILENDNCTDCGTCASQCPTGAISLDNTKGNNNELCIGCMRCVSVCPVHARGIGERLNMLAERLKPLCSDRKQNELFV